MFGFNIVIKSRIFIAWILGSLDSLITSNRNKSLYIMDSGSQDSHIPKRSERMKSSNFLDPQIFGFNIVFENQSLDFLDPWIHGSLDSLILCNRDKSLFCLDPWITGFPYSHIYWRNTHFQFLGSSDLWISGSNIQNLLAANITNMQANKFFESKCIKDSKNLAIQGSKDPIIARVYYYTGLEN